MYFSTTILLTETKKHAVTQNKYHNFQSLYLNLSTINGINLFRKWLAKYQSYNEQLVVFKTYLTCK